MARKIKNKRNRYKSRYLGGGIMRGRQYQMGGVNSETESKYVLDDSELSSDSLPNRLYPAQRYKSPAWMGSTSIMPDEHLRRQAAGLPVIGPNWRGMSQREDFEAGQKYGPILGTVGERIERHGPTWEDYAEVSSRRLGDTFDYLNPTFLKEQQRQFPDVNVRTGKIIKPEEEQVDLSVNTGTGFAGERTLPFRRQTGGMYSDNTVQAAGQGRGTSTANIVFQEQNPELQEQRLQALEDERNRLVQSGEEAAASMKQQELLDKEAVQEAADTASAGFESGMSLAKTGFDTAKKAGAFKDIIAKQTQKQAVGQGLTTAGTSAAGTMSAIPVGIAAPTAATAVPTYGAGLIGPAAQPAAAAGAAGSAASTAGQLGGAGIGTGVGKFLTSGGGIGTVAALAGTGLKMLSDDQDPTKYNVGEVGGDILSSAGTGAALGSALGPVGTLVGGVGGAIYGGVKGLVARNKARKKKRELEAQRAQKIQNVNEKTRERLGSYMSVARAGELGTKTYSGYDVGRNVTAQLGGMRMGMPRYGYVA